MKKILLILVMFFCVSINAQEVGFKKSDLFVEGSFSYSKSDDVKTTTFKPTLGYFFTDKFAVGASLDVTSTSGESNTDFSVFGRYYFFNIGNNFKTYSQLGLNDSGLNLGIGANYFVSKNLALSTNLANLAKYSKSSQSIGFNGVDNPLVTPTFGLTYKF